MSMLQQISTSLQNYLQNQYVIMRDANQSQRIRFISIILLPVAVSFILVQMQQLHQQHDAQKTTIMNGEDQSSLSLIMYSIHFLGNSTTRGIASLIVTIWHLTCRVTGIAVGIGLGLGLAGHIYEMLEEWKEKEEEEEDFDGDTQHNYYGRRRRRNTTTASHSNTYNQSHEDGLFSGESSKQRRSSSSAVPRSSSITLPVHTHLTKEGAAASSPTKSSATIGTSTTSNTPAVSSATTSAGGISKRKDSVVSSSMEDDNSYHSLMKSAGYFIDNGTLRCQMVRGEQAVVAMRANGERQQQPEPVQKNQQPKPSVYQFDKGESAAMQMKRMWPNLSAVINESLAKLTEFVIRDYVASWYSKVDENVVFVDPTANGAGGSDTAIEESSSCVEGQRSRRASDAINPGLSSSFSSKNSSRSLVEGEEATSRPQQTSSSSSRPAQFAKSMPVTSGRGLPSADSSTHSNLSSSVSSLPTQKPQLLSRLHKSTPHQQRTMVLSTNGTRPAPFIDSLYSAFAYLLGMLATRGSENVNIFELLLLYFPHILGQNLRIYREMRRVAVEKKQRRVEAERERWRRMQMEDIREKKDGNHGERHLNASTCGGSTTAASSFGHQSSQLDGTSSSNNTTRSSSKKSKREDISEIAVVREYLLAGRLHRAVTFGLDVPSLLFADPLGRDCPPGASYTGNDDESRRKGHPDEDAILEHRLLSPDSTLINECELDYNRVLAAKMAKLVVPKHEIDSSIVRSMLVEMLAACVLNPIMGCFSPDYVNGWILKGLGLVGEEGDSDAAEDPPSEQTPVTASRETSVAPVPVYSENSLKRTESVASSLRDDHHEEASVGSDDDELLDAVVGDAMTHMTDIVGCEGSVTSEMEESLFGVEREYCPKGKPVGLANCGKSEQIITLLSMSIIELRYFIDFEECRHAQADASISVDWDTSKCREAVRHLVLVIEAALLFGGRSERKRPKERDEKHHELSEMEIEATLEQPLNEDDFEVDIDVVSENHSRPLVAHHHSSLSTALMELTADIDSFEKLVADAEQFMKEPDNDDLSDDGEEMEIFVPKPNDLSTLRTLIAAWLHSGQAFRVLSVITRAKQTILRPFYHRGAFLRRENYANDFIKLMRQLDGVEILVDTMAVLASQCLLLGNGFDDLIESFEREVARGGQLKFTGKVTDRSATNTLSTGLWQQPGLLGQQRSQLNNPNSMSVVGSVRANIQQNRDRLQRLAQSATESFHWGGGRAPEQFENQNLHVSRGNRPNNPNPILSIQQNPQNIPQYLDFSKNSVFASSLRAERERRNQSWLKEAKNSEKLDFICRTKGVREKDILLHKELHHLSRYFYSNTNEIRIDPCSIGTGFDADKAANVTVKAVAGRRKIEIPDEDSSFLLRGQPRPLKPAAIHRDQNATNLACKIYVAMYEEPAIHPKTKRFYGGRYLRQCLMKYYPTDRTASVMVAPDICVLDNREGQSVDKFQLPETFQKQRHPCLKVATGGILSSPLMDLSDFAATPRAGKALDFVYRMSLFERPMVELSGKKFVVGDATSTHRADASSLELSDASMSAAIMIRGSCGLNVCDGSESDSSTFSIKVSHDGTPLILLRSVSQESTDSEHKPKDEARPYRPSFIRAALFVKSARQEAQFQCLAQCIRGGQTRASSKVKSDELLQPTLTLLQFANSRRQDAQSILLRDLRFGMNHIDRGQLCRNGLLNPRYPTILRGLTTKVEGAVEVKTASNVDLLGLPALILFKIRCTAITEFIGEEGEDEYPESISDSVSEGKKSKRPKSRYFREEWTVLRSLRDFSIFHKHIKGQVSPAEHSASASARFVGAATAALTIVGGNNGNNERHRGPLVPSLSSVTKSGTLGLSTRKIVEKRKKLLDEYLKYLVSPNNLLSRCPELLKFLGAYTSLFPGEGNNEMADDSFGRRDIRRDELDTKKLEEGIVQVKRGLVQSIPKNTLAVTQKTEEVPTHSKADPFDDETMSTTTATTTTTAITREDAGLPASKQSSATRRVAIVRAGEIRLREVRRAAFRLLRNLFDLDNASFFRSRVISAIKTMTLAIATVQDFHMMLFECHLKYMNGDWISGWIFYVVDMFWPNGVFYTKGPDLTNQEKLDLKVNSKKILEASFPDQLKTVLGKHTEEGLDILHEMLQNRLVLKSMAYMLLDVIWGELFPELGDFVTGAECLEKEG